MLAFQGDGPRGAVVDAHPVFFAYLHPGHLLAVGGLIQVVEIQAADMVAAVAAGVGVVGQQAPQHRPQLPVLGLVHQKFQLVAVCRDHPLTSARSTPG